FRAVRGGQLRLRHEDRRLPDDGAGRRLRSRAAPAAAAGTAHRTHHGPGLMKGTAMVTGRLARSARVRPYAITGGRTKGQLALLLETLVPVPDYDREAHQLLVAESYDIYALCRSVRSIAEISADLDIPLGVVRVLVSY